LPRGWYFEAFAYVFAREVSGYAEVSRLCRRPTQRQRKQGESGEPNTCLHHHELFHGVSPVVGCGPFGLLFDIPNRHMDFLRGCSPFARHEDGRVRLSSRVSPCTGMSSPEAVADADAEITETIRTEAVATTAGPVLIASVRPQRSAWTRAPGSPRSPVCRCRR